MKKKLLIGIAAVVGIALIAGLIFAHSLFEPVDATQTASQKFVVPKGQGVSATATHLVEAGLIKNSLAFRLVVKLHGLNNKLQAGSFSLSPSMSVLQIAEEMTKGTNDVWVTVPEGWRREEIADSLAKADLPSFDKQTFLNLTVADEGKLFPDTYLVARESTTDTIYSVFKNTFDRKVTTGLAKEISQSKHPFDQVLTMASVVQREARGAQEMRHVAGILWNRVGLGMPIQADATLQYTKGFDAQTDSWWNPPLAIDRKQNSTFNTYLHAGLPPHPICNPGLDAIQAALNPLETDDLFYLHDPQGGIHYAQSLEEHNANINRYLR